MAEHVLKSWPEHFADVASGEKRAEVRKNDRGYEKGDILVLQEYSPESHSYTGRQIRVRVTHVTTFQQRMNYVVVSFDKEDPSGEGKEGIRVDGPGPAPGDLQHGREESPGDGPRAPVHVGGGEGGGTEGSRGDEAAPPRSPASLTTRQLAERIAQRVVNEDRMWSARIAQGDIRPLDMAAQVLDELELCDAWFCRLFQDEEDVTQAADMEDPDGAREQAQGRAAGKILRPKSGRRTRAPKPGEAPQAVDA